MTFGLVLPDNASFDLLGLVLVVEAEKHESEASATLRNFFAHHDRVLDLAKLLEVRLQVLLQGAESQTADEKFDLVLLSRLVERGSRSVAAATATCLVAAHMASAHPTREAVLERRNLERHRHLRQVVLSHVTELPKLAQLHQVEAIAARRLS